MRRSSRTSGRCGRQCGEPQIVYVKVGRRPYCNRRYCTGIYMTDAEVEERCLLCSRPRAPLTVVLPVKRTTPRLPANAAEM